VARGKCAAFEGEPRVFEAMGVNRDRTTVRSNADALAALREVSGARRG